MVLCVIGRVMLTDYAGLRMCGAVRFSKCDPNVHARVLFKRDFFWGRVRVLSPYTAEDRFLT